MNFFFSKKYTLTTQLSKEHVIHNLTKNIDQNSSIFVSNTGENAKRFKGKIEENSFRISRYIDYKNSFLPVIKGDVFSIKDNDTEIQLKMSTHLLVKIFSIIWFSGFTIGSIIMSIAVISSGNLFPPLYLVSFIPIIFFLIFNHFFKKEVKIAKEILMQQLEAIEKYAQHYTN